jgi:VanZ family protein
VDKAIHLVMFAALALSSLWARIPAGWTALWLGAFAVVSEFLQEVLPINRNGSIVDLAADAVGVAAGFAIARWTMARWNMTKISARDRG